MHVKIKWDSASDGLLEANAIMGQSKVEAAVSRARFGNKMVKKVSGRRCLGVE